MLYLHGSIDFSKIYLCGCVAKTNGSLGEIHKNKSRALYRWSNC